LTDDYEGGDPLSGSGLLADDYGEESWAGESPWEDPEADDRADQREALAKGSRKREGESSYHEAQHLPFEGESELDKLSRQIRALQDAETFRSGVKLNPHLFDLWDAWDKEEKRQGLEVSHYGPSPKEPDWVALPTDHPALGDPFDWEPGALIDQTNAGPLGASARWQAVNPLVEAEWWDQRPTNPHEFSYHEWEQSEDEHDAMLDLTYRLIGDATFQITYAAPAPARIPTPATSYVPGSIQVLSFEGKERVVPGPSPETCEIGNEALAGFKPGEIAACHGYANCCVCPFCLLRATGSQEEIAQPTLDRVAADVRLAQRRVFGEDPRGGPRERGPSGKAKRRYPFDRLSGSMYAFDFRAREKGLGKKAAHDDADAVSEWLAGGLVSKYGERWIKETDAGTFSLADYQSAMKKGRKDAPETRAIRRELSIRARELKDAGAFQRTIAQVLHCTEQALGRLLKKVPVSA
jgi:hypothetical protein